MNKLIELSKKFCSVSIEINPHKSMPGTVEQWIEHEKFSDPDFDNDCSKEIQKEMIARDSVVEIHCSTISVGFYYWIHYDLEFVLDRALEIAERM
jgi:hypothetical protein